MSGKSVNILVALAGSSLLLSGCVGVPQRVSYYRPYPARNVASAYPRPARPAARQPATAVSQGMPDETGLTAEQKQEVFRSFGSRQAETN